MPPWLRKLLRRDLSPEQALADAEQELDDVYATRRRPHRPHRRPAPAPEQMEKLREEVERLTEKVSVLETELAPLRTLKARMSRVLSTTDGGPDG